MKRYESARATALTGKNWIWDLVPGRVERTALLALSVGLIACVYLASFKRKILNPAWTGDEE